MLIGSLGKRVGKELSLQFLGRFKISSSNLNKIFKKLRNRPQQTMAHRPGIEENARIVRNRKRERLDPCLSESILFVEKPLRMLTTVMLKQKKSWKILKRHLKRYRKPHKKLKRRPRHSVVIPVKASIGLIKSKRCQRHKVQFRGPGIVITKEPVGCVNNFRK